MSVSELDIWRSAKLLVNRYGDGLSVNVATVHGYIHPRTAPHLGGGLDTYYSVRPSPPFSLCRPNWLVAT